MCVCVCVYSASLKQKFQLVAENVTINPNRKLPSLSFWLNKNHFDSQHALLWCLSRKYPKQLCVCVCLC